MNSWPQFQGRRLVNALLLSVACFWGATGLLAAAPGLSIALTNGQAVELVRITAGQFMMGSPTNEPGRNPDEFQHRVRLKRDYLIGREPVTVGQFEAFTRDTGYRTEAERGPSGGFGWNGQELVQRKEFTWRNPGFPQTATHPVVMVTWDDARAFCSWVSRKAGRACRLPSEAEWEFACRSGSTGAFPSGAADEIAWHLGNSGGSTHPVGGKRANLWGLHDMAGNVFEWCSDWHAPYASAAVVDPAGPASAVDTPRRVLRGGSWLRDAKFCRSAARYRNSPLARNGDNGFRVVVETPK